MHLAKIFPAVAFVKRGVVGDEPDGRYSFTFQIFNGAVEQLVRYAPAPMFFFRVNGADIRGEVFSVVKIVCDNAETSDDVIAVHAEIPTVLRFSGKIIVHAENVSLRGNAPF